MQTNFSNLCPGENSIFIIQDSKHTFPLFQRDTLCLSSKAICYMNILEKVVDNEFSVLWLMRRAETQESQGELSPKLSLKRS